jgi:hypothetical protein
MMVARHEMPGKHADMIRPVGDGLICGGESCPSRKTIEGPVKPDHTVPYGTRFLIPRFQAFHAWLPSSSPYGTMQLRPYGHATLRLHHSNTQSLHHSARPDSRTRTTTRTRTTSAYTP